MVFVRIEPKKKQETPAEVPSVENPNGFDYIEPPDIYIKKKEEDVSASGKERRYDEKTGDPLPFATEELNEVVFQRIIKTIKSGTSPYQACVDKRVQPDEFFRKCKENKAWADELAEAREVFAESKIAQMELLSAQLKRKTLSPLIYEKITKNIIWMVERLFPALYGNKAKVEFATTHTIEIDQNRLKELNDMLRASQKVIEVEYQEAK